MTTSGHLLIPLSFLLILLPWRYIFAAFFIFVMLADVAVIVVGAFGVKPALFFGNLMIGRCAVELVLRRQHLSPRIIEELYPLMFLFLVNIVVLWVSLTSFQGKLYVVTGTMGFNLNLAQPYHLARENFTQIFYLATHIVVIYAIAHQLMRFEPGAAARIVDRAVILAMSSAAGIVIWELAAYHAGVPFPEWFFHSDLHSDAWGQVTVGKVLRASGPFPEPAGVGFFFGGFALYAWKRYKLKAGSPVLSIGAFLTCLLVLAASTSTTAFAAMGLAALVVAKDTLGLHLRQPNVRFKSNVQDLIALALLALGPVAATLFLGANWETVDEILTQAVFEKDRTGSFRSRTSTDLMALDILIETGGIGIGLGSHKPNSAVMTILSNTGILGFLAVGLFFFRRLKPYRHDRCALGEEPFSIVPLQWLLIGLLFAHAISNPNVNHVGVWMVSGMLVGITAGVRQKLNAFGQLTPQDAPRPAGPAVGADWEGDSSVRKHA